MARGDQPRLSPGRHGARRGSAQSWLFNSTLAGIEAADVVLLVGTNPRIEAPVLNARFRKQWLAGKTVRFGVVGEDVDLTYRHDRLGAGAATLDGLRAVDSHQGRRQAERPR